MFSLELPHSGLQKINFACPLGSACEHSRSMSSDSWQYCSVCAEGFVPEEGSNNRPVLYRCVTCSDLASGDAKDAAKRCLHICTKCHEKSGLYHASSHCWAKVFVSTTRGAYDYKKGLDWISRVSAAAANLSIPLPGVETPGTRAC